MNQAEWVPAPITQSVEGGACRLRSGAEQRPAPTIAQRLEDVEKVVRDQNREIEALIDTLVMVLDVLAEHRIYVM